MGLGDDGERRFHEVLYTQRFICPSSHIEQMELVSPRLPARLESLDDPADLRSAVAERVAAPAQEVAFPRVGGAVDRGGVRGGGLRLAPEAAQQVGARGMEEVIVAEYG